MAHKYFKGIVPKTDSKIERELDLGLKSNAFTAISDFMDQMPQFAFHKGIAAIWKFISHMNKYIDMTTPWVLAKNKSCHTQLQVVIYNLLEGLRIISGLIYPIMPKTAKTMQAHLGLDPKAPFFKREQLETWNCLPAGTKLPKSITLFPRIEISTKAAAKNRATTEKSSLTDIKPEIDIKTFGKVDLRVATVIKAKAIPRARKLLELLVDLGHEKRTIVSGIAGSYTPDDLVDKQVIIVANLKPAKLMGVLSKGMLLAIVNEDTVTVATSDQPVKPGSPIT